jgi:tripartite-type tricarboxylate transporter receptor subunit TctC
VIVENRPGAGGLVALNGVYMAPADGLTIMIVNGTGAAFSQLTDEKGARYDLGKIGYVATLSAPPSLWTVGPHFGVKTIGEALKANKKMALGRERPGRQPFRRRRLHLRGAQTRLPDRAWIQRQQ